MYLTTTLTASAIEAAIGRVSRDEYSGNLNIEALEHVGGKRWRLKLGTLDSHDHGSRTSWSGRHGRYMCWHAFRDVFAALFLLDPDMRIRTGYATYDGAKRFLDLYPATAYLNVGSMARPAYPDELCVSGYCRADTLDLQELEGKVYA